MSTMKGRISKLSTDKEDGSAFGFQLQGVEGYFNFSKPEYRKQPWHTPVVGGVVEITYTTADNGKRYISTIERLDEESEAPPWESGDMGYDEDMNLKAPKAERLAEVVTAEQLKEKSIHKSVAMQCAAQVVAAHLSQHPDADPHYIAKLIDQVLERFLDKVE